VRTGQHLVFANSRHTVERYADLLTRRAARLGHPDLVYAHHGNLDQGHRAHVEGRLGEPSRPVTVVCTSTLELGIDIGTMTSIAQLGAPPSVAGLRQRLGRSGRRDDPAVLRIYVTEAALDATSPPADALRVELVQTIAMIELLLERWCEPPPTADLHLSTLIQQILAVIAQQGGISAADAYSILCGPGPFQLVTIAMFAQLLRDVAAPGLVEQAGDGTLLLGARGEQLVEHFHFYAAFDTPDEYRLLANGRQLGTLPVAHPVHEGGQLIFAGHRWTITSVHAETRTIELVPASGGVPPRFAGTGIPVHDRVRAEMVRVYRARTVPRYLDPAAETLLAEGRTMYRHYRLDQTSIVEHGCDTILFPWAGDRIVNTLAVALRARDLRVDTDGFTIIVQDLTPDETRAELRGALTGPRPDPHDLAALVANRRSDKHDWVLGDTLLNAAYAARHLDIPGAWHTLEHLVNTPPACNRAAHPTLSAGG
jgi:ATP-dependent helicase Lhr and Lhr-like helicase